MTTIRPMFEGAEMRSVYLLRAFAAVAIIVLVSLPARAVVQYEQGRHYINGIALLQDKDDPKAYYYLPKFPRVSERADGGPEFFSSSSRAKTKTMKVVVYCTSYLR